MVRNVNRKQHVFLSFTFLRKICILQWHMDSAQAIWEHRPQKNKTVSTVTIICCRFGLETEASLHDAHKAWFQEEKKTVSLRQDAI